MQIHGFFASYSSSENQIVPLVWKSMFRLAISLIQLEVSLKLVDNDLRSFGFSLTLGISSFTLLNINYDVFSIVRLVPQNLTFYDLYVCFDLFL